MAGKARPRTGGEATPGIVRAMCACVVASGFAALVYEVLWLKELRVLFGSTAHASAIGFGVFFSGLAAGSRFWGRRAGGARHALVTYARLELGIAASATLYFGLTAAYQAVYAPLHGLVGHSPLLVAAAKAVLAGAILLPPAFLMGGTVPLVAELVVVRRAVLGRRGASLYALNTAGAAAGALAAGFYLPAAVGFARAYAVAMAVNVLVAAAAALMARRLPLAMASVRPAAVAREAPRLPPMLLALAAISGFLTIGLEVAATRLFAQVLQNSVYTFSTILVVFLLSLACGAAIAGLLARRAVRPWRTLGIVLVSSGTAMAAIPFIFYGVTDGLRYLAPTDGWTAYVAVVAGTALLVLAVPATIAGIVFPLLLRVTQDVAHGAARTVGTLSAWNTAGAVAGSLAVGFGILPLAGLWVTFTLLGAAYVVTAGATSYAAGGTATRVLAHGAAVLVLVITADPRRLPLVRLDGAAGERLLDVRESAYGVTAVVARGDERRIKVNNYYSLGGSGSVEHERNQALLPLLAHPAPASVFFLGLGSGITAGAAVQPPVRRLVVAELIPDVITAARRYFGDVANGLFSDPRVRVVADDGRHYLAATAERFDLVIADLFVPWEAGTGGLYTLEHFRTVRERLTPGGAFVQWLPLYQMSKAEFMTIARTMLAVFPHVTLWRGDFFAQRPIVALVGGTTSTPLDPERIADRGAAIAGRPVPGEAVRALVLPFYAGHLSRARGVVPGGPLNTDDRPLVEYAAPVTQRQQRAGAARWFTEVELLGFFRAVLDAAPPAHDPYLAAIDPRERAWVEAGYHHHAAAVHRALGRADDARRHADAFDARVPPRFRPVRQDEPADRLEEWELGS